MSTKYILQIKNLKTSFPTQLGKIYAADQVSLNLPRGEMVALVGESGSGKSVTAMSVLRLIQSPGCIEQGEILFHPKQGESCDVLKLSDSEIRKLRGGKVAMIFQEPMTSLNPVFTVGDQIIEAISLHQQVSPHKARKLAIEMIERVGIPNPDKRVDQYPHELSGGMRQRIMIAMGLSCKPELLIADEPTTALDVTIQAQILELIQGLTKDFNMSVLLITHDLGVVAEYASRVAVMYAGQIVEEATTKNLFAEPKHRYTKGLLDSIPGVVDAVDNKKLKTIPGQVPHLAKIGHGCRFKERCEAATPDCQAAVRMVQETDRKYRCIHPWSATT